MKYQWALVCSSVVLLTGCMPHLTQQQCSGMNWNQLGLNDGLQGRNQDLNRYIQDCSQFHVTVNVQAYQAGLKRGLAQYCSYTNGVNIGSTGAAQPAACATYSDFMSGYQKGAQQFCKSPDRGFELGSKGIPYPAACSPMTYPAFSNSYDRGNAIHSRTSQIQDQLDTMNNRINDLVNKYQFRQSSDGYYKLGHHDQDAKAQARLAEVNNLVAQRNKLQNQMFKAQTAPTGVIYIGG